MGMNRSRRRVFQGCSIVSFRLCNQYVFAFPSSGVWQGRFIECCQTPILWAGRANAPSGSRAAATPARKLPKRWLAGGEGGRVNGLRAWGAPRMGGGGLGGGGELQNTIIQGRHCLLAHSDSRRRWRRPGLQAKHLCSAGGSSSSSDGGVLAGRRR